MTLSQEQQPQERRGTGSVTPANPPRSRREARDAERRAQAGANGETNELPEHPSGAYEIDASGNLWESVSHTTASQLTDAAAEAERRTGRRVADRDREHTPVAEPLSYATQARPNIPTYDAPSFRDRLQQVAESAGASSSAAFRERDFAPSAPAPAAPARADGGLDYHTQTRRPLAAAAPAPAEPAAVEGSATLDHTLTRRELRVLRETGAIPPFTAADLAPRAGGWQAPVAPVEPPAPSVAPPVGFREPAPLTPVAGIPLGSAFSSFEDTATAPMSAIDRAALAADEPVQPRAVQAEPIAYSWDDDLAFAGPSADPVEAPISPVSARSSADAAKSSDKSDRAESAESKKAAPEAPAAVAPTTGLIGFEALIAQASSGVESPSGSVTGPQPFERRPSVAPDRSYSPPTGHWSVQAEREEDNPLPFDGMLSRNVGSSSGSTNALIMPSDPQPDLMHALNSTGEILVTGSLDLPRSLSSTGAPSDHYDSSEIDRLFEASQEDHHNADVAPVRAARAVSTHTSTRSVVSPRKNRSGNLPMILAISAAALAAGVVVVLITGIVMGSI